MEKLLYSKDISELLGWDSHCQKIRRILKELVGNVPVFLFNLRIEGEI